MYDTIHRVPGVKGKSVEVPLIGPSGFSTAQRMLCAPATVPRVRQAFFLQILASTLAGYPAAKFALLEYTGNFD